MNIGAPLTSVNRQNYDEAPNVRGLSSRDPRLVSKQWQKAKAEQSQNFSSNRVIAKMQQDLSRLKHRIIGMPPQENFYPFKIYQPDISTLATTGRTWGPTGAPLTINIDATVPTNLPTTINPTTDGWRIWAVRNGLVSQRSYSYLSYAEQFFFPGLTSVFNSFNENDYSCLIGVTGCDGIGVDGVPFGLPSDFDVASEASSLPNGSSIKVTPIVLPAAFTQYIAPGQTWALALYAVLPIEDPSAGQALPRAELMAKMTNSYTDYIDVFPDISYYATEPAAVVPIGAICANGYIGVETDDGKNLTTYQIQIGHALNRYASIENNNGNSFANGLILNLPMNYRGDFLNDTDLQTLAFYPGDVVKIQREIDLTATSVSTVHFPGTGTVTTATTIAATDASGTEGSSSKLFAQSLYLMTTTGFTTDPTTDPNWIKISGLDVKTQTTQTPNT